MTNNTAFLNEKLIQSKTLNDFFEHHNTDLNAKSFGDYLYTLLDEKSMKFGQVLSHAQLPESTGYQFLNGRRTPSRNKVFQIVFGAGFNLNEANQLLKYAGKSELYVKEKRDAIIMFSINKKMSLIDTEQLLSQQQVKGILNEKD